MGLLVALAPTRISLPRYPGRVGLHIGCFEACSAFTHVAACTRARSPSRDRSIQRLQTFRLLHACSGCFRLERLPGVAFTPLENAAFHGARGAQPALLASPGCGVGSRSGPRCYHDRRWSESPIGGPSIAIRSLRHWYANAAPSAVAASVERWERCLSIGLNLGNQAWRKRHVVKLGGLNT